MSKINECDKEQLIQDLKKLHKQAVDFIANVKAGNTKKHYSKQVMKDFIKTTGQLDDYIQDIEYGLEADKSVEDWCEILGDILLDDDNFVVEEDGFSWYK